MNTNIIQMYMYDMSGIIWMPSIFFLFTFFKIMIQIKKNQKATLNFNLKRSRKCHRSNTSKIKIKIIISLAYLFIVYLFLRWNNDCPKWWNGMLHELKSYARMSLVWKKSESSSRTQHNGSVCIYVWLMNWGYECRHLGARLHLVYIYDMVEKEEPIQVDTHCRSMNRAVLLNI